MLRPVKLTQHSPGISRFSCGFRRSACTRSAIRRMRRHPFRVGFRTCERFATAISTSRGDVYRVVRLRVISSWTAVFRSGWPIRRRSSPHQADGSSRAIDSMRLLTAPRPCAPLSLAVRPSARSMNDLHAAARLLRTDGANPISRRRRVSERDRANRSSRADHFDLHIKTDATPRPVSGQHRQSGGLGQRQTGTVAERQSVAARGRS